jgi:hypothetical protein
VELAWGSILYSGPCIMLLPVKDGYIAQFQQMLYFLLMRRSELFLIVSSTTSFRLPERPNLVNKAIKR